MLAVFALGPLAVLLAGTHPASRREWIWLAALALWAGAWTFRSGGLAEQVVRASGVLVTGGFAALVLWRPATFLRRGSAAVALGFAATAAWCWWLGLGWGQIRHAVAREGWEAYRLVLAQVRAGGGDVAALETISGGLEQAASLFPALLALVALAGLAVAWQWYHLVATRPVGRPLAPFRAFTFSDHLVWGAIAALGLVLAPLPPIARLVGGNLLLVGGVLYALRGGAVLGATLANAPRLVVVLLVVAGVVMFPVAASGLVLLGLADVWIDFRRRLPSPTPGGLSR